MNKINTIIVLFGVMVFVACQETAFEKLDRDMEESQAVFEKKSDSLLKELRSVPKTGHPMDSLRDEFLKTFEVSSMQ